VGKQYAVIIGIDRYKDWMPLKSAVKEAKAIKQVLGDRYFVDEFIELYDDQATGANIRRMFADQLPKKLDVHDSVLVFYAGHGYLDSSQTGFWIPVDGSRDIYAQTNWIPNAQLRNYVNQLKAQRVLVMADSCFSGDFLNTSRGAAPIVDSAYFKNALTRVSRQVLSSGASETVPDESEFGRGLLSYLQRNTEPVIDALSIYDHIRLGVSKTLPLFGTLPGNETGASFVLFLRESGDAAAASAATTATATTASATSATPATTVAAKGRLEMKAAANYAVKAVPQDKPGDSGVALGASTELVAGTYNLAARISDDSQDTWTGTVTITPNGTSQLTIPQLGYSKPYQVAALTRSRDALQASLAGAEARMATQRVFGWVSLGLGLAGAGTGLFGLLDGQAAYPDYQGATDVGAATAARARLDTDTALMYAGFSVGGVGIAVSPLLWFIDPAEGMRVQVNDLNLQIQKLSQ
jgi:hypothetical protein